MNKNSKVWDLSSTCKKVHAYIGGVALCRKNILHPGGDQFSHLVARHDFKSLVCVTCEHKAFIREEIANLAHAEALEINAALDAEQSEQECSCHEFGLLFEQYGHHAACHLYAPVINNIEENAMKPTKHKGPLNPLQHQILTLLCDGLEHAQIAERVGFTRSYISEHVCAAAAKMQLPTTAAAVARYGSYRAYREAAQLLLERGINRMMPLEPAEEHCNHVVEMLAQTLRERAERLLPQ